MRLQIKMRRSSVTNPLAGSVHPSSSEISSLGDEGSPLRGPQSRNIRGILRKNPAIAYADQVLSLGFGEARARRLGIGGRRGAVRRHCRRAKFSSLVRTISDTGERSARGSLKSSAACASGYARSIGDHLQGSSLLFGPYIFARVSVFSAVCRTSSRRGYEI
jgi:hypothetical protein